MEVETKRLTPILAIAVALCAVTPLLVYGQPQGYVPVYFPPRGFYADWMDVKAVYMREDEEWLYFYLEYYGVIPVSNYHFRDLYISMDADMNSQTGVFYDCCPGVDYHIFFILFGDNSFSSAQLDKWDSAAGRWQWGVKNLRSESTRAPGLNFMEIKVNKRDINYTPSGIRYCARTVSVAVAMPDTKASYVIGSSMKRVSVDGEPDDWGAASPLVSFPYRSIVPPEIEVSSIYVADDSDNLYFRYDVIEKPSKKVNAGELFRWFSIYIDADNNGNTGYSTFNGADFWIYAYFYTGQAETSSVVEYKKYIGKGVDDKWQVIAISQNSSSSFNSVFELEVPLQFLGVKPKQLVNLYFRGTGAFVRRTPVLIYPDRIPPVTSINIGEPVYRNGTTIYVSSFTTFTFSANDTSGIKEIKFRVDKGEWNTYSTGFTLSAFPEGEHTIGYYSVDNAGNAEAEKNITVILDKTPPVTTAALWGPRYQIGSTIYVSAYTALALSAIDGESGVREIKLKVDGGPWSVYALELNFSTLSEGPHAVGYYSVDNVDNAETVRTLAIVLDKTSPVINDASPVGVVNTTTVTFTVRVEDSGSGVREARLYIDGAYQGVMSQIESIYTKTLNLPKGSHTWSVEAVDNVGNTATQSFSLVVAAGSPIEIIQLVAVAATAIAVASSAVSLAKYRKRKKMIEKIDEMIIKVKKFVEELEES